MLKLWLSELVNLWQLPCKYYALFYNAGFFTRFNGNILLNNYSVYEIFPSILSLLSGFICSVSESSVFFAFYPTLPHLVPLNSTHSHSHNHKLPHI